MKILVVGDGHGNVVNLKAALEIGKRAKVQAIIHTGDWSDLKSFDTALSYKLPIYSVIGNADVDPDLEDALRAECKKFNSDLLDFVIDGRKIGVIHKASIKDERLFKFNIVFSGHWHSKEEKMVNFTKFVRPGGLINGINLAIYETITAEVEFINEETEIT